MVGVLKVLTMYVVMNQQNRGTVLINVTLRHVLAISIILCVCVCETVCVCVCVCVCV